MTTNINWTKAQRDAFNRNYQETREEQQARFERMSEQSFVDHTVSRITGESVEDIERRRATFKDRGDGVPF